MKFSELTPGQAELFCEHVVAREAYMLRDLATWLDQSGGPIELMDASLASLDPLWAWCMDFARADYLELADTQVPATQPELTYGKYLVEPGWVRRRKSEVLGDRLAHYIRLVVARLAPGAYWGVFRERRRPLSNLNQQTVVFMPGWHPPEHDGIDWPVFLFETIGILTVGAVAPSPARSAASAAAVARPDRLRTMVSRHLPAELTAVNQDRQPSVLTPYLQVDLPEPPALARDTPALAWLPTPTPPAPAPVARREAGGWSEMVLAKGPAAGLDDEPWLLTPLPVDRVTAALRVGGFTGVDTAAILAEAEFDHSDAVAHVMTLVHDGQLRALHIEPLNPTTSSWEELLTPLRALASELGAHLLPEGEHPTH